MELQQKLAQLGMRCFAPKDQGKFVSDPSDPYFFETYIGLHEVKVERGDCAVWISADAKTAYMHRGPEIIKSPILCTVIRGYAPESKSSTITNRTVLPYINGCSTKQIFAPDRPGDPTLQLLFMPAFAHEQAHHIHPTARCVYVVSGRGLSVVGMGDGMVKVDLVPGMICILERMCPHHFETQDESLVVLPLHIWSSVGSEEFSHPMVHGTFKL